jgi:hypothetical protein
MDEAKLQDSRLFTHPDSGCNEGLALAAWPRARMMQAVNECLLALSRNAV